MLNLQNWACSGIVKTYYRCRWSGNINYFYSILFEGKEQLFIFVRQFGYDSIEGKYFS